MGTDAHVMTVGTGPEPAAVVARLQELERRWTRFDDRSELSRIGACGGHPVVTSPETLLLVERSVEAWRRTAGRFDPSVIGALEALGYDRDFDRVRRGEAVTDRPTDPAPGLADVIVDTRVGLVQLPAGVRVDPGGLGKGLAADLAAVEAVAASDDGYGILVSVGGDLRAHGRPPAEGWEIELDHLMGAPARLNLRSGAVATSSVLRRRWEAAGETRHHVIDPRTGRPSTGAVASVSVLAADAWWAEVLATLLLLDGDAAGVPAVPEHLLADTGALLTLHDGRTVTAGPLSGAFLVPSAPGPEARFRPEAGPADHRAGSREQEHLR
jgi:thiamine biosynthesis lipoprotein